MKTADRMKQLESGIFQVLNDKKKEVQKQGRKVYNLSVGTPDFEPAPHVMEAVAEAAKKPENYKYALDDLPQLTAAVQHRFAERYQVRLEADEIMSVYGSQEGITHIGLALFDPGDLVLVPDPGYPIFSIGPFLAGADVQTYDLLPENGYLPDLPAILEKYGDRIRAMIVSYPLNPICKCAPHSFYEKLIPWAKENDILIIHDNAYSDIIYDGRRGFPFWRFRGRRRSAWSFTPSRNLSITPGREWAFW